MIVKYRIQTDLSGNGELEQYETYQLRVFVTDSEYFQPKKWILCSEMFWEMDDEDSPLNIRSTRYAEFVDDTSDQMRIGITTDNGVHSVMILDENKKLLPTAEYSGLHGTLKNFVQLTNGIVGIFLHGAPVNLYREKKIVFTSKDRYSNYTLGKELVYSAGEVIYFLNSEEKVTSIDTSLMTGKFEESLAFEEKLADYHVTDGCITRFTAEGVLKYDDRSLDLQASDKIPGDKKMLWVSFGVSKKYLLATGYLRTNNDKQTGKCFYFLVSSGNLQEMDSLNLDGGLLEHHYVGHIRVHEKGKTLFFVCFRESFSVDLLAVVQGSKLVVVQSLEVFKADIHTVSNTRHNKPMWIIGGAATDNLRLITLQRKVKL